MVAVVVGTSLRGFTYQLILSLVVISKICQLQHQVKPQQGAAKP